VVLYWRPIVPGWNDQPGTMQRVLASGRDADAIVFTGYYHKEQIASYLRGLGVSVPYGEDFDRRKVLLLIEDGHAWTHGLGEQRRYAIQHALGFQIWELDQPHLLHAHGRALTGYQPAPSELRQLAAARARFTEQARSDEED
jgi:hypothetical protein